MSLNYASALSPYTNKGKCGLPEKFDSDEELNTKCQEFARLIDQSENIVVLTGAGLSTSCGIPDFRGPNGVWTLEKQGKAPEVNVSFENARPSFTHYALVELAKMNKVKFVISQNIDGLHLRSGFPMNRLADLHGNMFVEKCSMCQAKFVQSKCSKTIGFKSSGQKCNREKPRGICRGDLQDTILDWEDSLPAEDMALSELSCKRADLCICLGTTLQIMPVGSYPLLTKKNNGKIVIVNLQETRLDRHADLVINQKLDIVFRLLFEKYLKEYKGYPEIKTTRPIEICLRLPGDSDLPTPTKKRANQTLLNVSNVVIDPWYQDQQVESKSKQEIKQESGLNGSITENGTKPCDDIEDVKQIIMSDTQSGMSVEPNCLIVISGKRKSGKDYVTTKLVDLLKSGTDAFDIELITLSAKLKEQYAKENNLDYERLLDSSSYKEIYRADMIKWSDEKRSQDPFYFCQKAVEGATEKLERRSADKFTIWIITDARRKTDLKFFNSSYPSRVKTVRVVADEAVRIKRAWIFTEGVDDTISEMDLDDVQNWDFVVKNDDDSSLDETLQPVVEHIVYITSSK